MDVKKSNNAKLSQQETEMMNYYIKKVKEINEKKLISTGKKKFAAIETFGCQMNVHDSETLTALVLEMGYDITGSAADADLIIYNTCCVRENAENKVYGNLGFLKNVKENKKDLKVALCGCMMQQESVISKIKNSYKHVDIIFGTFNLHRFPQLFYTNIETGNMIVDVWSEPGEVLEDLPAVRECKHKVSVNIMYGCNNFCSYCIVPYVRGRERSRKTSDIILEIKTAVATGAKEVMLLGQNVNSYCSNIGESSVTFPKLLEMINEIEGIERIRFMTSHPKDLSDDLIFAIRNLDKVCNHLHLPLQSGSSSVLSKMNRHYTKETYLHLIYKLKHAIPSIAITTDIIVGFPGETEEDFQDTLDIVKQTKFSGAFTFIYSKRTGTPAANMANQVSEEVLKERFSRLLEVVNPIIYELNCLQLGKTVRVLADEYSKQNPEYISGRAENNVIVHFKGNESHIGKFVDVRITDCKSFYLTGKLLEG